MSQRGQVPLLVGLLLKPLLGCIADVLGGPKPLPVGSGDVVDLLPLYFHCLYNNISTALWLYNKRHECGLEIVACNSTYVRSNCLSEWTSIQIVGVQSCLGFKEDQVLFRNIRRLRPLALQGKHPLRDLPVATWRTWVTLERKKKIQLAHLGSPISKNSPYYVYRAFHRESSSGKSSTVLSDY